MNREILQVIAISAFLHDTGKFAERAQAVEMGNRDMVEQEYRYAHAHHTELALKLLFAPEELQRPFDGKPELNVLNLAARHHKPRNIYEQIITQADRIASGHERATGDDSSIYDTGGRERKRQTPLLSILSRIHLKNSVAPPEGDWRYRIGHAGIAAGAGSFEEFFPVRKDEYTYDQVERDYRHQWDSFRAAIRPGGQNLHLFEHFPTIMAVCREFQWCLPASTRKEELPDVSLYDHQKVSAALASCLYYYHAQKDTLAEQELFDRCQEKFMLFCGDISGIQKFIYQISSKGAYRTLKGKSLYIQLLAEVLAREFVEAFGLSEANILYASGGKFYLMLPNLPEVESELGRLRDSVNTELFVKYNGDLYLRAGYRGLSARDLTRESGRTLYQTWDQLARQLVYRDRQRYAELAMDDYDSLFDVQSGRKLTYCTVCHRTVNSSSPVVCGNCKDMEEMGRQLGTARWIAIAGNSSALRGHGGSFAIRSHTVWLLRDLPNLAGGERVLLFGINAGGRDLVPAPVVGNGCVNSVPFIIGSSHRFDVTFDEIAQRSTGGFKRLGILRMDVDSLGKIFSEGLENYQHGFIEDTTRFHSLGRITTLSWQLSQFFGAILPAMIRRNPDWHERVTVVYSGGDDLFLLGAWDALPEVALEIRKKFAEFSCHNRSFCLSGGMVITRGDFPIYKSAEMAGEAEAAAKANTTVFRGRESSCEKESLTFFDTPMHWQEFEALTDMQGRLTAFLEQKENYPLLRRLRDIALSWHGSLERNRRRQDYKTLREIHEQIEADKWRWRMVYALSRFGKGRDEQVGSMLEGLQKFIVGQVAGTERTGIELLGLLSRWCELRLR